MHAVVAIHKPPALRGAFIRSRDASRAKPARERRGSVGAGNLLQQCRGDVEEGAVDVFDVVGGFSLLAEAAVSARELGILAREVKRCFADLQLLEIVLFGHHPASCAAAPLHVNTHCARKAGHAVVQCLAGGSRERLKTIRGFSQQARCVVKEREGDAWIRGVAAPLNAHRCAF